MRAASVLSKTSETESSSSSVNSISGLLKIPRKIRKNVYLGISDTPAWIVAQANTLAQLHGWSSFVALQIEYSLAQRDSERDLIPMARAFDLAVTAWSPLAGGILSGNIGRRQDPRRPATAAKVIRRMDGNCASKKR